MIATVSPSLVTGSITAPASKSTMQRACALALLNNGITIIQNAGDSNDDKAALDIICRLGASVEKDADGNLLIISNGKIAAASEIDCGESGLSLRMFTPIIALSDNEVKITGKGSLITRPVALFESLFPLLDVAIQTNNGVLPIIVKGPLIPRPITMDGSQSSQYVTGILFAFAKAATASVIVSVTDLKSKPYADLSIRLLQQFGYLVTHNNYTEFHIGPAEPERRSINYYNEADWSGGAFLLVAGVIAGNITVRGLSNESTQADRAILNVLISCGANVSILNHSLEISRSKRLSAFNFDATDCPDLFPPLAVLALYCDGTSVIKGTSRLAVKESDRARSLTDVFTKMGGIISVEGDEMIITGGNTIHGAEVEGHHDHRIVMACAVAALRASGDVVINGAEAVEKSYPDFFAHLKMLSATVSLT